MKSSIYKTWGTRPDERCLEYPCDRYLQNNNDALYRGVSIDAPPEVIFRWLCQLRKYPYSYDWIDNLGRRSPDHFTPGLEKLVLGQDIMMIFELVDFTYNKQMTIRMKQGTAAARLFGDTIVSYVIVPGSDASCRLLVKLVIPSGKQGVGGTFFQWLLAWGDLIMMRRQLLNFKRLAETKLAN